VTPIPTERKQVAAILAKLSLHYWRPDFSPEQARLIMGDYLDDLRGYSPEQVCRACSEYRKLPDAKFFPTSGALLALLGHGTKSEPRPRLPTFRAPNLLSGPRAKFKSVGDVLREHGEVQAAEKWESRQ
jgi:hypothetical protein